MVHVIKKQHWAAAVLCCVLLGLIPFAVTAGGTAAPAAAPVNWGLSFGAEGTQPRGNASAADLREYDAWYLGDPQEPVIYLTFDAGYENGHTEAILDTLKKHGAPAAFFVVGHYLESAPELVRRMAEEGHIVGNHTFSHPDMSAVTDPEAFARELNTTAEKYRELTGKEMPKYYRPPRGKFSRDNLRQAQAMGYATLFWSLAYVDWEQDRQPTPEQAFQKLIPRIHNGAVVLLHSTSATNAAILDELLTRWEKMGYRFGTLDELIGKT